MLTAAANHLLRVLLAPACAACDATLDRPLDGTICPACWRAVPDLDPPLCAQCGDALVEWRPANDRCPRCRRGDIPFSVARAGGVYEGPLRVMIHALKYARHRGVAAPLASRMRERGAAVLQGADAVVPVPLHPWRQWQRGFNQADDLAMGLGLPVWRALRRRRGGPAQAGLPLARRHGNVRQAFAPAWLEPLQRGRLRGATVVLVDDVMTSGATLAACARVLRQAGAADVRALTAARAVVRAGVPDAAGRRPPPPPPRRPSTARRR